MSDFQAAREAMETGLGDSSPAENQASSNDQALRPQQSDIAQAMAELDKMERFKFQGQEWTPKDLEKAILRQKDYTQKTQTLAEQRKAFDGEQKFYSALAWDLIKLRENPQLINEFVRTYPEKFHAIAEAYLRDANTQGHQPQVQQKPQADVQTLSRLERLEKFYNEQEVQKNELQINQTMESLSQKYPNAGHFKEMVLGRALELHSQGTELTRDLWESIFKQVDEQVDQTIKAKYGDFVKKQKEANSKARDVAAGGGTAGAAPKKFKNLSEVRDFAIQDLTSRGG